MTSEDGKRPVVGERIYVDQGDSAGQTEIMGTIVQVVGTLGWVEISDDNGQRWMINLSKVVFWE